MYKIHKEQETVKKINISDVLYMSDKTDPKCEKEHLKTKSEISIYFIENS